MTTFSMNPRMISTKFDSVCAETGTALPKGTQCLYFPCYGKVFALKSEYARVFQLFKDKFEKPAEASQKNLVKASPETAAEVAPVMASSEPKEKASKVSKKKVSEDSSNAQDDLPF